MSRPESAATARARKVKASSTTRQGVVRFGFGRRASRLPELWQVTPVCASFQREEETVALDLEGPPVPESGCGDKWMHGWNDR